MNLQAELKKIVEEVLVKGGDESASFNKATKVWEALDSADILKTVSHEIIYQMERADVKPEHYTPVFSYIVIRLCSDFMFVALSQQIDEGADPKSEPLKAVIQETAQRLLDRLKGYAVEKDSQKDINLN